MREYEQVWESGTLTSPKVQREFKRKYRRQRLVKWMRTASFALRDPKYWFVLYAKPVPKRVRRFLCAHFHRHSHRVIWELGAWWQPVMGCVKCGRVWHPTVIYKLRLDQWR